ncbi:Cof-type HAD-IIB family hydrolase [Streptococcus oricebi]|uniref:Cof-type HAD-IIB family hydrolase n=1 Tax=Streptococcus oricebi TaxID=1547447 RepID=A0ABS5B383_9STRE|nr:Cof-type HAD-IIB family hydrolase [Streptococcus oricebi]MBP2622923.1 Cof-type HAD-IIB family hydrolase [Streptococcus oricebi]
MTEIKLIALDLDGTLLTHDKKISERNLAALKAAHAQGVKIVLTTGRPLKAMEFFLKEIGIADQENEYTITFNGGLVQRNTGEVLDKIVFSYEDVAAIHEVTQAMDLPLDAIHEGHVYQIQSNQPSLYSTFNPALNFIPLDFENLDQKLSYNKCITACPAAAIDRALPEIPQALKERYGVFKSRDQILEWCPKEAHKANGLAKLIAHLGLETSQVMAMGDEANDLSMIAWAGLGVAMKNAVPAVKEAAEVVTPLTNDEDGVAWAIEKYVLSK